MSITSAMFSGVSGLLANAEGINVIGNNLANVNTVGFKYNRMLFADMMYVDVGNGSQLGRGTQIQKIDTVMGQGAFENSEVVTDLAIQGEGFFALGTPNAAAGSTVTASDAYYTRAGTFRIGAAENVLTPAISAATQVENVTFSAGAGVTNGATITVGGLTLTFNGTVAAPTAAQIGAAFANIAAGTTAAAANAANAAALAAVGGTFSGTMTGYSSGAAGATVVFTSATPNSYVADLPTAANGTGVTAPTATITTRGTAAINGGYLPLQTPMGYKVLDEAGMPVFIPEVYSVPVTGAPAIPTTFQKITTIENNGVISLLYADVAGNPYTMYYSGGTAPYISSDIANAKRVGYATVANPPALSKEGGTLFRPTVASGLPTITKANGNNSKIFSNSLEQSNVDMAAQFVKMILTQRAYSANSKTITTADEMTQEVLNLKR